MSGSFDTWATRASMPTARFYSAGSAANGVLYVVGGATGAGSLAMVEAYQP
jgi:hypothetical protein